MSLEPEHLHFVTIETNPYDGEPVAKFECKGTATSKCHQYPACDCERWDDDHEHPNVSHDECWIQGWFDSGPGAVYTGTEYDDMYDDGLPRPHEPKTGPVTVSFEDEWVAWEWVA